MNWCWFLYLRFFFSPPFFLTVAAGPLECKMFQTDCSNSNGWNSFLFLLLNRNFYLNFFPPCVNVFVRPNFPFAFLFCFSFLGSVFLGWNHGYVNGDCVIMVMVVEATVGFLQSILDLKWIFMSLVHFFPPFFICHNLISTPLLICVELLNECECDWVCVYV